MKSEKGITLTSLIIYIIVTLIVLGILAVITSNFQSNVKQLDMDSSYSVEFDKFNSYFIEEVKKIDNFVMSVATDKSYIQFANGNVYQFSNGGVYLRKDEEVILISNRVTDCTFETHEENEKTIIKVTMTIEGITRTNEYTMRYTK